MLAVFSEPPNTAVLSACRGRRLRVSAELKRSHLSLRREAGGPLASPRSTLEVQGLTGPRDLRLNEPLGGSCARRSRSRPGSQAGLPRGPSPRRVRRPLASPLPAPASTGWAQLSTLAPLPTLSFPESLGRPRHRGRVTEGRCPLLRKYPACQLPGLLLPGGQQCGEHEEAARGRARGHPPPRGAWQPQRWWLQGSSRGSRLLAVAGGDTVFPCGEDAETLEPPSSYVSSRKG